MDVPLVQEALNSKGKITNKMLEFIYRDTNPLELKLAIINAIGWKVKGLTNSQKFYKFVINKKKYKSDFGGDYTAFNWNATADELICYAYMKALDNYFDISDAFEVADLALKKNPNSFAVNMIYYLIKAQGLTTYGESCYASKNFNSIIINQNHTMDMRKEAMPFVFEYMDEIGKDCKKE